jgi:thiol-disulfide isomerase/thioredoxin
MTMRTLHSLTAAVIGCLWGIGHADLAAQSNVYTVPLTYNIPGEGPRPNYSPTGTKVALDELPSGQALPDGAVHPARRGVIQVGPTPESWIPMLLTATADDPGVFTRLYIDMNRNGEFSDDGPPALATVHRNEETGNVRIRFEGIELRVRFPEPERTEPFVIVFWLFHWAGYPEPDSFIRYSGESWRTGSVTVNGVPALVAAMDKNNDAVYGPGDDWGVVEASMPDASKYVMSVNFGTGKGEMNPTDRLMFLQRGADAADLVLEFRSFAADGSAVTFAVVDHPTSKAEDRAADDLAAAERTRPRATTPYTWTDDLERATAAAKVSGKRVFLYFETDWCAPCLIMDEWIWTDAEVVAALRADYVGVMLDGDVEKELVRRYGVKAYPTMLILDPASGTTIKSVTAYQSSQELLEFLRVTRQ